jgi:hypothetical protein
MCLFKDRLEKIFYPSQKKLDALLSENTSAWDRLHNVIQEKKEAMIPTKFPQFQHVAGRPHVNPR